MKNENCLIYTPEIFKDGNVQSVACSKNCELDFNGASSQKYQPQPFCVGGCS